MNFRIAREVFVLSTIHGHVLSRLALFADTRMLLNLKTSPQVGETVWPSTPSSTRTSKASVEDLYFIRLKYIYFVPCRSARACSLDDKPTSCFFFSDPNYFDLKASCKTITERTLITRLMWLTKNFPCRSCLTLQVRECFYRSLFFLLYWVTKLSSTVILKERTNLLKPVVGGTSITHPSSSLVK